MKKNDTDIGKAWESLKDAMYYNHHGILLERATGGYYWNGNFFSSLEEVDEFINQVRAQASKTIHSNDNNNQL